MSYYYNKKVKSKSRRRAERKTDDTLVKTVQKFSKRGAYVYIPNKWLGKKVRITLLDSEAD